MSARHPRELVSAPAADFEFDLELVIPVLNEEHRVGETIAALIAYLEHQPWRSGLLVVDNGSTDRTIEVVDAVRSARVPVRVVGCSRRGKGAAVGRGMLAARGRWVGFCDADLSTPVETIGAVMDFLADGHEVVIGSRRCAGAHYKAAQPLGRRMGGFAFRSLARRVAPHIHDTQCGFKFFTAELAHELFVQPSSSGFAFDVEIIGRALAAGRQVLEVPVEWSDDHDGSSFRALRDGPGVMRVLLRLRSRLNHEFAGAPARVPALPHA